MAGAARSNDMEVNDSDEVLGDAETAGTSPLSAEEAILRLQARARGFAARRAALR